MAWVVLKPATVLGPWQITIAFMIVRPSGAGGMALFPRPCDLSVTPTLVFPPANPAMFRRFRSLPKIGGFKLTQGFSSIFNRPYTALFHLMSATFADELSAAPRAGYQQVYAATPSCPELDLIRTDLTGNVRMFRSVFLWNTLHNFLYWILCSVSVFWFTVGLPPSITECILILLLFCQVLGAVALATLWSASTVTGSTPAPNHTR